MITDGEAAAEVLQAALTGPEVACIAVRTVANATRPGARLKTLIEHGQAAGVAMLVVDDIQLARTLRADGVHLRFDADGDMLEQLTEARERLGGQAIVGVEPGPSRHVAMAVGEAGADYIAFAADTAAFESERDWIEIVGWWADIFEIPCVAICNPVGDLFAQAQSATHSGAEFVAAALDVATAPAAARDAVRNLDAAINGQAEPSRAVTSGGEA